MSASSNDKITQSMNGGSPVVTTVASPRSIGGTSLSGVALTNWPTATRVFFTTYKKTTSGAKDFATVTSWWAIVSGTTLGTLTRVGGAADAGNAVGDFIEMGPTAGWAEGIYEFGTKEHATDGTHDPTKIAMLAGTQTFTGAKTFSSAPSLPDNSVPAAGLATNAITLGYVAVSDTSHSGDTSDTQITGASLTVTVSGGRRVELTFTTASATCSSTSVFKIWRGAVGTGTVVSQMNWGAGSSGSGFTLYGSDNPGNGSFTYNISFGTTNSANAVAIAKGNASNHFTVKAA